MSHVDVLREIESRGLTITASGEQLRLQGPRERVDPELIGRIKAVKAELIAHLTVSAGPAQQPDGLAGGEQNKNFPLTSLQRSYLIGRGDAIEMGNVASHVYHEIEGAWDLDRLESALRSVVARHGMLRTRFTAEGRQIEQESADVRIGRLDLRGVSEAAQVARRLVLREERAQRLLPTDRVPLLAVDVTILTGDRMVLHVDHDGLVMDGISMFLFFREWWDAYSGGPSADEQASFEAYVAELGVARSRAPYERSRAYWLERLDDLPPHPGLPLRTSPSAITRPRFSQHVVSLDAPSWTALKARAAGAGLTPTTLLIAAYAETLARWGAGARFTLATTLANRPPIHPRIHDAIGNFSETMLVSVDVDRRLTFEERARGLQARLRRHIDHRHFSGIEVLRELGRRNGPVRMPYTFNSAIGYVLGDVDGSALELFGPEVFTSSQTPQLWLNGFAFEQHGGVVVQFDSVDGLFPEGLIEAMASGYRTLLAALVDEAGWSAATFDLLPSEQKARRRAANDTGAPLPQGQICDPFRGWARRAPLMPAIVTSGASMSYGELYRRACHAAAWLRSARVERDELVGLVMARGPEQIVGMLAAVLAGAAYLPVDAGLPLERRRYMLADGRVRCVLTNAENRVPDGLEVLVLDATARPAGGVPGLDPSVSNDSVGGGTGQVGEGFDDQQYRADLAALPGTSPDDLAYVLYTSGTTGQPKGVMVSHRSVMNVVADCNARFGVGTSDRFFGISAFTFDLSVYDVFGALSAGAAIVLPDGEGTDDPAHWLELCGRAGVTVWNSVPAIVGLLHDQAADGPGLPSTLRLVMMSGDRIPPALPGMLWRLKEDLDIVSLGGPTETTIWNILHPIAGSDVAGPVPYGRPNANNRAYILDADGQDTPDWITGEICAAGAGPARGYWGDPARTAARFVADQVRGERLYRTGDLGHYLPDGNIAILGRSDFQLKKNGYRIEAGEVETRLVTLDAVKQAVVVCLEGTHGDRLVAHLVPAGPDRAEDETIKDALREQLPEYMLPEAFVWHEALPLTRNGKVDRAALVAAAPAQAAASPGTGRPTSEAERQIAGLWASVLRVPEADVDPDRDFYDLGGDSLAAARILTRVRKTFGVGITLDRFAEVGTVRAMAAHVTAGGA